MAVGLMNSALTVASAGLDAYARRSAGSNGFGAPEVAMHDLHASARRLDIQLGHGDLLSIREARGAMLCVERGIAWLTQDNDVRDILLDAGACVRVDSEGLALVGARHGAIVTISAAHEDQNPEISLQRRAAADAAPLRV
jgi:hypothetical protein